MLPYADVLQTIAEVTATFAGFTAILVVFRRRVQWSETEIIGLVHFLQISLGVVLLSLAPFMLSSLELSEEMVWRVSNALLGAYHAYLLAWILPRAGEAPSRIARWARPFLGTFGVGSTLLNVVVAVGALPRALVFALLFGLLWLLAMALVNFVFILMATVRESDD